MTIRENYSEDFNDGYYHVGKDIEDYPDAWCIVTWSKRGPGKTYSGLWYSYGHRIKMMYAKRTVEDVNLICAGGDRGALLSPYKALNRDKGINIIAEKIQDGLGAFYECADDGEPVGDYVALIMALNKIKTVKGFDASDIDWLLVDEFIPQIGERTSAGTKEGELLLDLYMTISRDRIKRGRKDLKLILFANAEEIATPITNTLEIVDDMSEMNATGERIRYLADRGILLHHITDEEVPLTESEQKSGIFKAMSNTSWGRKSFGGEFANNDFSNVCRCSIKNMQPLIHLKHKSHHYYIYIRDDGFYYMTTSHANCEINYDLNLENDQRLFYDSWWFDLRNACINGDMKFKKYSMYDLLVNYKKYFKTV